MLLGDPEAAPDDLWENLIGEPVRRLSRDYTLAVGVEVDVIDLVPEPVGAVVAAGVDGLMLYTEWEEASSGWLHSLYRAYPPVHEWSL